MLQIIYTYVCGPIFMFCGLLLAVRSFNAFRNKDFNDNYSSTYRWHRDSFVVGIGAVIIGLLFLLGILGRLPPP